MGGGSYNLLMEHCMCVCMFLFASVLYGESISMLMLRV